MRVTAAEVKEIMDNCTVTDTIVDVFIAASEEVITKTFYLDASVTDALLKEIERWYTAHLITATLRRQATLEEVDDVRIEYAGKYGMGLDLTSYGQMVKTLDTTGKMKDLGKTRAWIKAIKSFTT